MLIIVPQDVTAYIILDYTPEGDTVQQMQKHESSLLGQTSDDTHFALLFPPTLSEFGLCWVFWPS